MSARRPEGKQLDMVDWVEAKLEGVYTSIRGMENTVNEVKKIALSAKDRATAQHPCAREGDLRNLRGEVNSWSKWWRGIMVTVILGVFVMSGWVYSDRAQSKKIERLDKSVTEVKAEVKVIWTSQKELTGKVDYQIRADKQEFEKRLVRMKNLFEDVLDQREGLQSRRRRIPRKDTGDHE